MNNLHYVILTISTRQITHANQTPLQMFISSFPFILMILCAFIIFIVLIKSEDNINKTSQSIAEPDTASGKMLYNSLQQTKAYYKNNRIQMTIIFVCAIISCFVGLTVLMISVFYFNDEAKTMGIISGTVVSFISGTFFWIYKQCNNQVQHYFNELIKIQNIFIAIELTQECNDEVKNTKVDKIIDYLINSSSPSLPDTNDQQNQ